MLVPHVRRLSTVAAALALVVVLSACASSGGGDGSGSSSSSGPLTRAELVEMGAQVDAYQAVQRLRPMWLRRRGVQVMLDGLQMDGGAPALRQFRTSEISRIEYLSPSDATTRFGTGYPDGVILVTTGG